MRLIMAFDCGRTAPLSGLHIQSPLHTELLLFKYFTVWSNASDVQHMLSVHLGRCANLQGGFTTVAELSWHPPPPTPPPGNSGMSSGCKPMFYKGDTGGVYVMIS